MIRAPEGSAFPSGLSSSIGAGDLVDQLQPSLIDQPLILAKKRSSYERSTLIEWLRFRYLLVGSLHLKCDGSERDLLLIAEQ